MPRPKTKEELLSFGEEQFQRLLNLINTISNDEIDKEFSFDDRDRNVRDVLVHLHEWHLLLIDWINNNLDGKLSPFLPEGYNFKTYPKLNIEYWEKHQVTPLDKAKKLLLETHYESLKLISKFTNEELFTKKFYNWTGTTSVGSYCVSATSSHYDWAFKKIKKHKKLLDTIE